MFDEDRYFDVFVEYAKADADEVLVRITVANRSAGGCVSASAAHVVVPQRVVEGEGSAEAGAEGGRRKR